MEQVQPVDPLASLSRQTIDPAQVPIAPWAVWRASRQADPLLAAVDALAARGLLEEALLRYQDLLSRRELRPVRVEVVARELGTLLQMGQSQRVLERASQFLQAEGYQLEGSPSAISLMVGYAYLHQRNFDQAIAWFSKSIAGRDPGAYSAQAKSALEQLVQSIETAKLGEFEQRWRADDTVGKLFVRERIRRGQGAAPGAPLAASFFAAQTYRTELPAMVALRGSAVAPLTATAPDTAGTLVAPTVLAQRKLGVLLPLSGQYAEHALKVKHGIELAAENATPPIEIQVVDTQGDPILAEQGYINLVQQGAAVVLGPLLVKTTEQVAARTAEYRVPIISFTKRTGIPQLGPEVFRLGVTVENQIDELLRYATEVLGLRRFAVLYPEVEGADEYAYYFKTAVRNAGGILVGEERYYPGETASVQNAVSGLAVTKPQAIFIPDRLDSGLPLFEALQASELGEATLLGTALWDDPVAIRGFGQLLDGAVFVTPYLSTSPAPDHIQFTEAYRKRFGHSPELLAAQAFDAAQIAIAGVDQQRSSGAATDTLRGLAPRLGITGQLEITTDGEINRRMSVLRLFRGEVVEVVSRGQSTGFTSVEQSNAPRTAPGASPITVDSKAPSAAGQLPPAAVTAPSQAGSTESSANGTAAPKPEKSKIGDERVLE